MKFPRTCISVRLCAAVVSLTAMPIWADGELDTSFGTRGVVKIQFPDTAVGSLREAAVVNGVLDAVGFQPCSVPFPDLLIVRVSLAGAVIGSPGRFTQNAIRCPTATTVDPANGDIYVSGGSQVARFDASGTLLASYVASRPLGLLSSIDCAARRVLLDNQGRFLTPCVAGHIGQYFGSYKYALALLRLNAQGEQLLGEWLPGPEMDEASIVAQDTSAGFYYVGGACCRGPSQLQAQPVIVRLVADSGSVDTSYATANGGVATANISGSPMYGTGASVYGIALDAKSNVVIGGSAASLSPGYVARFDPTGSPDTSFGASGVVQDFDDAIVDIRTDSSRRVYALGTSSTLLRLTVDGSRDATLGSSSNVQALNGPGSAWQSIRSVDGSTSSAYLLGGAVGCDRPCSDPATTAVIAKVTLVSDSPGSGRTTTVLNSSAAAITDGQTLTLTATVLGTAPTGHFTFKDGAATLGTVVLHSGNLASYQTSGLTVGRHYLTASYSGDANNSASMSQTVLETVKAATTTVLASSTNPVQSNHPVTFTATVAGGNPTGIVTFTEHWTDINGNDHFDTLTGPQPDSLTAGSASLTVSGWGETGTRSISATYSGDSENSGSTSAALVETITNSSGGGGSTGSGGGGSTGGGAGSITWVDLLVALVAALWKPASSIGRTRIATLVG